MKVDYNILNDFKRYMKEGDIEKQKPLSDNTVRVYLNTAKLFIDFLNENNLELVDHKQGTKFLLYLKNNKNYKETSLMKEKMAIITFYKFLDIPFVKWKIGTTTIKEPNWFKSKKDIFKILKYCINIRDMTILTIVYESALRVSEVHKLNVSDIVNINENWFLRLVKPKKQEFEYTLVPLFPSSQLLLGKYLEVRKKQIINYLKETNSNLSFTDVVPLFINSDIGRLSYSEIQHIFKMASKRAGFDITNIHSLRHSRCTHLILQGMSLAKVSRFMRHKNIETTMRYFHWVGIDALDETMIKKEVDKTNTNKEKGKKTDALFELAISSLLSNIS